MSQSNPNIPPEPPIPTDEIKQRRDITAKEYRRQFILSRNLAIVVQVLGLMTIALSFCPTPVHPYMITSLVLTLIVLMVQLVFGRSVCTVSKFKPSRYATKSFTFMRTTEFRNMIEEDLKRHHLSLVDNPTTLRYDPTDRMHTLDLEKTTAITLFYAVSDLAMLLLASLFVCTTSNIKSVTPFVIVVILLFAVMLALAIHKDEISTDTNDINVSYADYRISLTSAFKELIASDKTFEAAIDKRKEKKQQNGQSE